MELEVAHIMQHRKLPIKLYDFLNGVENQLKVDKNLLDKMII